jgi:hypothetical protein
VIAYVASFGAFGAGWDDATVARWSANPLDMLWPKITSVFQAAPIYLPPTVPSSATAVRRLLD